MAGKKVNNDKVILDLKTKIEEKKKLLSTSDKFSPITNCSLELYGSRINIHTCSKESLLLNIAHLQSLALGLAASFPEKTLMISGYAVESWIADCTNKYNHLNRKEEQQDLEVKQAKLEALLTSDTQTSLAIDKIKNELGL